MMFDSWMSLRAISNYLIMRKFHFLSMTPALKGFLQTEQVKDDASF